MTRTPLVRSWDSGIAGAEYDLFIAAVGYERRARYVAETITPKAKLRLACAFPTGKELYDYSKNLAWYRKGDFKTEEVSDGEFRSWLEANVSAVVSKKALHACVDISSMSRFRIATLVDVFRRLANGSVRVDFLYSIARFSPPPAQPVPNAHVGPVIPAFSGWWSHPNQPADVIVGLGYEQDKALGAVEHIEASRVWAFIPGSRVRDYLSAQEEANALLLETIPLERQISYPVEQPLDCFVRLESLANRLSRSGNLILFPFGPKIFALNCVLVACLHPTVAVWRVSAGAAEPALDRVPQGDICGLSVNFERCEQEIYSESADWEELQVEDA